MTTTDDRGAPRSRPDIEQWYRDLQQRFCGAIAGLDGSASFVSERWDRPGGGGGISMQLTGGKVIERGSVNFSAVWGEVPERMSESLASESPEFYATGLSVIVHPLNPYAPTFHANLRFFSAGREWFGGGADLTPSYIYEDDARHFHGVLRDVCHRHPIADYPTWKGQCDEYFWLPHRQEARGVGGVFFDHLVDDLDAVWLFQRDFGDSLIEAYAPIVETRKNQPYGKKERHWQMVRRGRYVEFNLVWDRGTRFGLETGGRTESILGSLPPIARWEEPVKVESGSNEEKTLNFLRSAPTEWVE